MECVAIDFETGETGEPWQLGAVLFEMAPGNARALEWHDWRFGSGGLLEKWDEIYPFLAGRQLVAHNIACEKTILVRTAPLTRWGPWLDTLKIAKKRYPDLPSHTLGDLCNLFGCVPELDGRTWHDGLFDAFACGLLYAKIG